MVRGVGPLLRHALRRDRVLLTAWLAGLSAMVAASAFTVEGLYTGVADVAAAARVINSSPGLVALYGPVVVESSPGDVAMSKLTVTYAMGVMAMAIVLVRRHTRTEEESGRAELVASTQVSRGAPLLAALLLGVIASVVVGTLAALIDIVAGLPVGGSVAFGLVWLGAGLVGTGIAGMTSQLSASARTCGGLAVLAVATIDLVRAVGDLGPGWLGWLSPLGWGTRMHAWGEPRWWVAALYLTTSGALVAAAVLLRGRRDLGAGVLPDRAGPARGRLAGTAGLLWRQERTTSLVWWVAVVASGVLFGSVVPHLDGIFASASGRAVLEALGGPGRLEKALLAALLSLMAVMVSGYTAQVVAGVAREETEARTELVLAAGASRHRYLAQVVGLVLVGSAVLALSWAVAAALAYGPQRDGVGDALTTLVPAAAAHVPAIWVLAALTVLAWTLRPRAAWIGWALLAGCVVLGDLGPWLGLPDWVVGASPFDHVGNVPVSPVDRAAEAGLLATAALLVTGAWLQHRRRDIG